MELKGRIVEEHRLRPASYQIVRECMASELHMYSLVASMASRVQVILPVCLVDTDLMPLGRGILCMVDDSAVISELREMVKDFESVCPSRPVYLDASKIRGRIRTVVIPSDSCNHPPAGVSEV